MLIAAEAENGKIAVDKYKEASPDLTLLDITMPEMELYCYLQRHISDQSNTLCTDHLTLSLCKVLELYPLDFAKSVYETFMAQQMGSIAAAEPA